jgi:hypothetical protein
MSFGTIDSACANRSKSQLGKGLCWGYIFGLVDANLTVLQLMGKRFCIGAESKEHAIDLVLSMVKRPRDIKSGADVFYSEAILKLAKPCT